MKRRAAVAGSTLAHFGSLSAAEKALLQACRLSQVAVIAGSRPNQQTKANQIRAQFVRFLAVGGDEHAPVPDSGVHLAGAWLIGSLDLFNATVERPLALRDCYLESAFIAQASFAFLNLQGCRLAGPLQGDGLRCRDDLRLDRVETESAVWLAGATIGGDLVCNGGSFGRGLAAGRAMVGGSVILANGFRADETVDLARARIGGDLLCLNSHFRDGTYALRCDEAHVQGGLIFRRVTVSGGIDLGSMRVGSMDDDLSSWRGAAGQLVLDGFSYDRLAGQAPIGAEERVGWLLLQPPPHIGEELRTQPWDQLVSVLRALGHVYEARKVAIAKETRLRIAGRIPSGLRFGHWLYGQVLGYGYRPTRLIGLTAMIWLAGALFYWAAINPQWFGGSIRLIQPEAKEPSAACLVARAAARRGDPCPSPPPDYRSFSPFTYSANVLLPAVSFDYTADWKPVVTAPDGKPLFWGRLLRSFHVFETLFGLFLGLQLAGMFGSLIKKE